jgi:hypothetical protein
VAFDPDEFMNQSVDQANDTHYVPIPEGDYIAIVDAVGKPMLTDEGRIYMHIVWHIDSENLRKSLEREKVTTRQTLWLDVDGNGKLDTGRGKNVPLGRLREALGLNSSGPFRYDQMVGRPAYIKVTQRKDKDEIYDGVKSVAPVR